MNRSLKLSILLALTVGGGQAAAVELGQVHVRSALGQPLLAEIPVTPEGPADLANLSARLASSEDFARAGIAGGRPSVPMLFSIADAGPGKLIRITSSEPINDPLLDLLVEVDNASGQSIREFTILLDPPGSAVAAPVLREPISRARSVPRASSASAPPAANEPRRTPGAGVAASNGRFGPVQRGQTLSSLARSAAVPGADINQVMLALKQANPDAFYRDNINALKRGAVLRVPTPGDARAQSAAAALAEVRLQNSDWRAGITRTPTSVADAATRSAASSSPSDGSAGSADHLSLTPSRGAGQGAAAQSGSGGKEGGAHVRQDLLRSQESLAALQQQGNDLKSRLKDLEDINGKNQKLLSLKDNEIAELQHELEEARKAAGAAAASTVPKPVATPAAAAAPTSLVPAAGGSSARTAAEPAASATASAGHAAGAPAVAAAAGRLAPAKPAPAKKPIAASGAPAPAVEDPWYMQTWAWAVGAVIVLLLGLAWFGRRRQPRVPAAGAASLADRFDTASPPPDDGEDVDQEELLDQLAEHPDDIGLHLELVSLYYHRRDIEHFEAAAEAMHAHVVDPEQSEWQDVLAMGEDLVPEHPLFAAAGGHGDHVHENRVHEEEVAEAQHDEHAAMRAFDLDDDAEADAAPLGAASKAGHPVGEHHFDFNLTPRASAGNTTPPLPDDDVDAHGEAPHHDSLAASAPAEASAAETPVEPSWTFEEPIEPAAKEVALEPFSDDPVDTKLDLARAYLDMGDAEGAQAMLDEVLHEGSQVQRDVARRLLDSLA